MQPAPLGRSGARLEKAAALGSVKHLRLYFASPDAAALKAAAQAIASPSSPDYRHYLTVSQFRALYAPAAATTDAVNSYLTGFGLRVGPIDPNGMSEPLSGTVKQLNAALHTTFEQVQTQAGAEVMGATEAPGLPANLAGSVSYIDGLTPWVQAHDNLASTSVNSAVMPPEGSKPSVGVKPAVAAVQECSALSGLPTDGMLPDDLASAYKLSGFYASSDTGQGVTVGLIEYDSYDAAAVSVWKQCLGASATIYVEQDSTNPAPSPPAHPEATADIETLMSIAPSANIALYETANLLGVSLDPWNEAITGAGSTAPTPSVISSSWGLCEAEEGTSMSAVYSQEATLFSEALMQGQTLLVASGDYGSEGCAGTSQLAVSDPASNPLVTAVGGTASGTVTGPQYVWNSNLAPKCLGTCVPGASGGGLSQVWAQPTYQPAVTSLQTGCSSAELTEPPVSGTGSSGCREVPDVSALAGNWYWQMCESTGTGGPCTGSSTTSPFIVGAGGTSLAAPSWAGAVALANEECKSNVGFLNPILYQYTSQSNPLVGLVTSGNNDYTQTNGGSYAAQSNGSQNLATGLGYLGGVDLSSGGLCLPPSVPTAVTTVPANGAVTVSWAAPKYQGASAVTGYTVSMTPAADPPCTVTLPAANSCTFSGLTNGTPYRFTLTASNGSGPGVPLTTGWVTPVPTVSFPGFTKVAGAAATISEGADGVVWVLGTASTGGGHPLYERIGSGWLQRAGGAVAIAVGPNGNPWVINNADQIYAFNGSTFVHQPGVAVAVSVGANGAVWVLGNPVGSGGHPIYKWTGSSWVQQPGAATSIAVGPTGNPWVTNSYGNIFQWNGTGWNLQSGLAATISEGSDGAVWVLGSGAAPGGHYIYQWTAAGWSSRSGAATAIAVGPTGDPWVVNNVGAIYSS